VSSEKNIYKYSETTSISDPLDFVHPIQAVMPLVNTGTRKHEITGSIFVIIVLT